MPLTTERLTWAGPGRLVDFGVLLGFSILYTFICGIQCVLCFLAMLTTWLKGWQCWLVGQLAVTLPQIEIFPQLLNGFGTSNQDEIECLSWSSDFTSCFRSSITLDLTSRLTSTLVQIFMSPSRLIISFLLHYEARFFNLSNTCKTKANIKVTVIISDL